nr:MAG TPA: hypothetical protein [Caudoviricetes sp.]
MKGPSTMIDPIEVRKLERDKLELIRTCRDYQYWLRNDPYGRKVARQKLAIGVNPYFNTI